MRTFLLASLLALFHAPAAEPVPSTIVGRWRTADQEGVVQISARPDGTFEGQLVGPTTHTRPDSHNPDPALRQRPLLGLVVLRGLRYDDGAWTNGTIYDPLGGKTYACTLHLTSPSTLAVRGYVGLSLFGRTDTWTRVP